MPVTDKSDVYSFGVVALEVMMGKHPGELLFSPALSALSDDPDSFMKDVLDQRLPPPTGQVAEEVLPVVSVALACTHAAPESHPPCVSWQNNYQLESLLPSHTVILNKLIKPLIRKMDIMMPKFN